MTEERYTNRLINEKSPYLLQHAHNPVDWYPWGEDAFSASKTLDRPIFLSIGYATCHWCHVMEKESFENPSIAKLMNESFVNIKVDREELPEIDGLYMEFAQAIIPGGGGWPLNVLLTPDLKPFFATTYIPPESGRGFIGLGELIVRLRELWLDREEREKLMEQATHLIEVFDTIEDYVGTEMPTAEDLEIAADIIYRMADPVYGGIKGEPKFPMGYHVTFLLRHVKAAADSRALFYVELTLEMMYRGGIYDHLGSGFSRYSVDDHWLIPHFEKMLYDSAILSRTYLETWLMTKKPFYREISEEILQYVTREMTSSEGGFFSAEDADSEGKEGLFYTWTPEEIAAILGDEAPLFCEFYGVTQEGTFEGRSVLHIEHPLVEFSAKKNMDPTALSEKLKELRSKLWKEREKRPHPTKDDKILVSWNGLMINSFVSAGRAFGNQKYINIARKAAGFIKLHLWQDGKLLRRWRAGEARFNACLDEYVFMIQALLTLFEEDGSTQWLSWAMQMTDILEKQFKLENGAFYYTDGTDPNIVLRRCEFYDGAEPSGNGTHCENLIRLYQITFNEHYLNQANDVLKAAKRHIENHPIGCSYHLMALQRSLDKHASTVVVALNEKKEYHHEIRELLFTHFYPHHVVIWKEHEDERLSRILPHTEQLNAINDQTTIYICERGQCKAALNDWTQIVIALTHL